MTERRDLLARLAASLDIPHEVLPGGFSLSMTGEREVTVRGCRRILLYREDRVELALRGRVLAVTGRALYCTAFSAGTVTVVGKIQGVLLEDGSDD